MSEQNNNNFKQTVKDLLHKGNTNRFSVIRKGESILSVSVTLFIIVLVCFCPATLIIMLIGLFCGCNYRFTGPDMPEDNQLNHMFDQLAHLYENPAEEKENK